MKATSLFLSVFVIATCGLVYELVAGALASYLLGDSITQFSLVIGTYLSAMGAGSYLSKYVRRRALTAFIQIELAIGLVGGLSTALLFYSYRYLLIFTPLLYGLLALIGLLVGLEIPLLLRILKDHFEFKELVARVLLLDYVGALAASLLFPFFLMPRLGLMQTAFAFGLANTAVGIWGTFVFAGQLPQRVYLRRVGLLILGVLTAGLLVSNQLTDHAERGFYETPPIYAKTSKYQRVVVTHKRGDLRLFLNGHLQFSSKDEHRYHEALVHPVLSTIGEPRTVILLGGGDGLALREVLKYKSLQKVVLVDLDRAVTDLFADEPFLAELNKGSLRDPKVEVIHKDALIWLEQAKIIADAMIIDLPDPSNYSLGKLYSKTFYQVALRRLSETGALAVQSTSPYFARKSYWCVVKTLQAAGASAYPYHCYVPSFGEWGYVLASKQKIQAEIRLREGLRLKFLDQRTMTKMFHFPKDLGPVPVKVNYLNSQALVNYHSREWNP